MKAEIKHVTNNECYVQIEGPEGIQILLTFSDKETAQKRADMFNKSLSQHVQSELSAKIGQLKKTFTDGNIPVPYPYPVSSAQRWKGLGFKTGAKWMRDEILKLIETHKTK